MIGATFPLGALRIAGGQVPMFWRRLDLDVGFGGIEPESVVVRLDSIGSILETVRRNVAKPPASCRLHCLMLADRDGTVEKMSEASNRPDLSAELSGSELQRWYWTMAELQPFARAVGVRAAGPKAALVQRLAAHLDGRQYLEQSNPSKATPQLHGTFDETTVIPEGQRSSTELRAFFEDRIGPTFRFDGHMRAFLKSSGSATLGDAIAHWYNTRGLQLPEQSSSLEFNRFTKKWHEAHPAGSAAEAREAWARYRALPTDER